MEWWAKGKRTWAEVTLATLVAANLAVRLYLLSEAVPRVVCRAVTVHVAVAYIV